MTKLQSGRRQKLILASSAVCFASALALSGCTISAPEAVPTSSGDLAVKSDLLANHGLEGLGAAEVIERLDTMPVSNRPAGLQASVQPDAVVLSDTQQREARLPLPEDGMYVSIAPYKSQTHDCYFHSLTTCVSASWVTRTCRSDSRAAAVRFLSMKCARRTTMASLDFGYRVI